MERERLNPSMSAVAAEYVAAGWEPVRVRAGSKAPLEEEWQLQPATPSSFRDDDNIGVLLRHQTDVDLDCSESVQLAPAFLPATQCISGRSSAPRSHYWYVSPCTYASFHDTVNNGDGKKPKLLELRSGDGLQTLVPPSTADGETRVWHERNQLAQVAPADLENAVHALAAATLLSRHYPAPGARHDFALALSGFLLRANWNLEDTVHFVTSVARAAGDDEVADREKAVHTTLAALEADKPATGGVKLQELVGVAVLDKVCEWLHLEAQRNSASASSAWPEPLPLAPALLPVSKFELSFLPECLRPLCLDTAERMQVPLDFPGIAATIALAGVVNRRARIFPKAQDRSWELPCNLWGALIAPPGTMKSPLVAAISQPLHTIEAEWREQYTAAYAKYEKRAEARKAERARVKRAASINEPIMAPDGLARDEEPPVQRRLLTMDATPEKLHQILANNPAGVLVLRDELVSWVAELDKPGRETERGFYLTAWSSGSHTIDRIGRGTLYCPAACISFLGCLQPARLAQYLVDADSNKALGDGLLARFQLMVWPDTTAEWAYVDRPPDAGALVTMERIFSRLAYLSAENPLRLTFAAEAHSVFVGWMTDLESALRTSDWSPALVAHLSKYRSLLPKLAALFELADAASLHDFNPSAAIMPVSLAHTEQALTFVNFLWGHARRIYNCLVSPEVARAQELAKHIAELPDSFSMREVYRHGWRGLTLPDEVRSAFRHLTDLGWIRQEVKAGREKGRPTETWEINPACRKNGGEQ